MSLFLVLALLAAALLAPFLGADSRDGHDWSPGHFWRSRLPGPSRASSPAPRSPAAQAPDPRPRRDAQARCETTRYA